MKDDSRSPRGALCPEGFDLHALQFHWDKFEPHLVCLDLEERQEVEFDLRKVDFSVSGERRCIGSWDDDGVYRKCPRDAIVTRFQQCAECSQESFFPVQECIFEPQCDGTKCAKQRPDWDYCRRRHFVYVAFYDTLMKVGMTSSRRIEKRLIEQGADAYSILGEFANRKEARDAEKDISDRLRIPQFYRHSDLLLNMSRPLNRKGIEGRLEALRITCKSRLAIEPEPIQWLTEYPIELPLRQTPKLRQSQGRHRGELVGFKGKWMVFHSGGLEAINLPDLTSRFLARHVA